MIFGYAQRSGGVACDARKQSARTEESRRAIVRVLRSKALMGAASGSPPARWQYLSALSSERERCLPNKKASPRSKAFVTAYVKEGYGLKRNFSFPRLAASLAFRRTFWFGVSKARRRRTSSIIPSASSLFFKRLSARSIGSPLRTITSGIKNLLLRSVREGRIVAVVVLTVN